jgi:hypothetical protein
MSISRSRPLLALFAALIAGACATGTGGSGAAGTSRDTTTEYYYGTMSTSSPDGKVPHAPPAVTLVRRDVAPSEGRIVETVHQGGTKRVVTLEQEDGGVFRVSSDDRSVEGEIAFDGPEWRWTRWSYAIELSDGSGTIIGTGKLENNWLETEKYFVASNGEGRTRIVDRLVRIDREEYERRLGEMR